MADGRDPNHNEDSPNDNAEDDGTNGGTNGTTDGSTDDEDDDRGSSNYDEAEFETVPSDAAVSSTGRELLTASTSTKTKRRFCRESDDGFLNSSFLLTHF